MLLIWGFRTKSAVIARLMLICGFCHNPAAQTVVQRKRMFTLFFVPLFPVSNKYVMQCAFCGKGGQLTKEQANGLVAQAAAQQQPVAPVGPPMEQLPAEAQLPAAGQLPATGTDAS